MVKVNWTDSAIQDLNDIGDYIANDSIRYAQVTIDKLFFSTEILKKQPLAGKMVPELEDETVRELIVGNYRIVYKVVNDFRIDILTINNCARLLTNSSAFSNED